MSEESNDCMTPGTIGWSEVITPNKSASVDFYTKLMGWSAEDMEMPNGMTYTMFKQGDKPLAGCVTPPEGDPVIPMWLNYINTEDLDAVTAKAQELGATVLKERVDLPMGSFTIIADPLGAVIAFWQASGDCPSESQ